MNTDIYEIFNTLVIILYVVMLKNILKFRKL